MMFVELVAVLVAPAVIAATSLEYYRSAFCDAQSPAFLLDRHNTLGSLVRDEACHQTPARTMAMKLTGSLESACVVLAYNDYACNNLVGSIPTNGKCVAATKAKIGSWRARCNTSVSASESGSTVNYAPGELKRRDKQRLPSIHDVQNATTSWPSSCSIDATVVASLVASKISAAINTSATNNVAALVTSLPSAGTGLSSAINSGMDLVYNLTSYVTAGDNSSYTVPSMVTATSPAMVTFTGTTGSNGTAIFHMGGSSSDQHVGRKLLTTIFCGTLVIISVFII